MGLSWDWNESSRDQLRNDISQSTTEWVGTVHSNDTKVEPSQQIIQPIEDGNDRVGIMESDYSSGVTDHKVDKSNQIIQSIDGTIGVAGTEGDSSGPTAQLKPETLIQSHQPPPVPTSETFRHGNAYESVFQPMASSEELEWFDKYAHFFVGKPRKMKRIFNSYMVNRYIANKRNPGMPSDSVFYKKLLKFTILLEQWPYRMAWMLLVVENLQQEIEIIESDKGLVFSSIGESLMSLIERMLRMQDLTMEQYQDLPLIKVYHHFVQVLMHSSDDSAIQLLRDGDPQVFEQILLDDGESKLKLKDISLPGKQGCEDTLRPYAFNLQRHTVEKVAVEIDNCMLVSRKDGKIENIRSKKDDWFASYKKSSFFDIASNEHIREFKDEAYPADHEISNTTNLNH